MTPPNQLSTLKSKHKANLTPTIHLTLSSHFVDQWRAYFSSSHGREKESKIRGIVIKAIRENPLYVDRNTIPLNPHTGLPAVPVCLAPARFKVWIASRRTKAVLELTDFGYVGITVLDPACMEVLGELWGNKAGLV